MANRLCLGSRGSSYGLFISQPGFNVLTASDANLLFSTDMEPWQILTSGQVALTKAVTFQSVSITYPNVGFIPTVIMMPGINNYISHAESSGAPYLDFYIANQTVTGCDLVMRGGEVGYSYSGYVTYCVLRERLSW